MRRPEIDLLRTLAILMMVTYHTAYDLSAFFHVRIDPFSGGWKILQRSTAILFLLLVGVSFVLSYYKSEKRPSWEKYGKRGLVVLLCGMLASVVTFAVDPETYVRLDRKSTRLNSSH